MKIFPFRNAISHLAKKDGFHLRSHDTIGVNEDAKVANRFTRVFYVKGETQRRVTKGESRGFVCV